MNAERDQRRLAELVIGAGGTSRRWRRIEVTDETGSTNRDLAARAQAGEPDGTVLVAGFQSAGRGRLARTWTAPPDTSVAMSMLVHAGQVPPARWPWLMLLTGLAVRDALIDATGVPAEVKWPNDVLVGGRKLVGILAERVETPHGAACVIGCGINLTLRADQLPVPTATSLALEDARSTDRVTVVAAVLGQVETRLDQWRHGDPVLAADYRAACTSIGTDLRVTLTADEIVEGRGVDVDASGRIVLATPRGRQALSVGDVVHLRRPLRRPPAS